MTRTQKLARRFFARPTVYVARELLGKYIVCEADGNRLAARIVEVEAYIGDDDPACHASAGLTPRTATMFGPPGHAYIYLIYGMYHCFNFVTEPQGRGCAVLLRAAEPAEGIKYMTARAPKSRPDQLLSGPGKFCRAFGLTREHNALDLTASSIWVEDRGEGVETIGASPRVGIKQGTDRMWRFFDADSKAVSKARETHKPERKR